MVTGVLQAGIGALAGRVRRRVDPRASVTGKFVAAAVAAVGVTFAVVAVAVWQATVALDANYGQARAIYRGGILAFATLSVAIVVAFVERSVVRGLRALDRETRKAAETGRYEASFESTRRDEVGQLAWSVAELRDQLAEQVSTVESLNRDPASTATAQTRTLSSVRRARGPGSGPDDSDRASRDEHGAGGEGAERRREHDAPRRADPAALDRHGGGGGGDRGRAR